MTAENILVYTQSGWLFCDKVKEFLSEQGIDYVQRDVAQDADALGELEALGILTTPVTVIGGGLVVGFDRPRLERLLEQMDR